jgi:hypothetical protein
MSVKSRTFYSVIRNAIHHGRQTKRSVTLSKKDMKTTQNERRAKPKTRLATRDTKNFVTRIFIFVFFDQRVPPAYVDMAPNTLVANYEARQQTIWAGQC